MEPLSLKKKLQDADVAVRAAAVEALSYEGAGADWAALELVSACGDQESVKRWAVAALEDLGPPRLAAVGGLIDLTGSPDPLVAYWAVTLIGRLGAEGRVGEGALVTVLLGSKDDSVQDRAAWALGKLSAESQSAIEALRGAAESGRPRLAHLAQAALAR